MGVEVSGDCQQCSRDETAAEIANQNASSQPTYRTIQFGKLIGLPALIRKQVLPACRRGLVLSKRLGIGTAFVRLASELRKERFLRSSLAAILVVVMRKIVCQNDVPWWCRRVTRLRSKRNIKLTSARGNRTTTVRPSSQPSTRASECDHRDPRDDVAEQLTTE